jgi:hypothetical protein
MCLTGFYLASRVSQIKKNLERGSTEGLAPIMFVCTMTCVASAAWVYVYSATIARLRAIPPGHGQARPQAQP